MQTQNRRLAAILFTDVVGFTSIMQKDEKAAIQTIRRHNKVLEKWAAVYNGEVLNFFGDGCLCAFNSATEAVIAAMEVQKELQEDPAIPLRIGLHIGEISFEEGKALGDAVNLASRVQSLAVANSILFSQEIYSKLRNHPEFHAVSLGSFDFKNVDEPMEVYALSNEGFRVPRREEMAGKLKDGVAKKKLSLNKWVIVAIFLTVVLAAYAWYRQVNPTQEINPIKSIAVLPFKNENIAKAENEPICNGITLALIKNLTWVKEFIPIAFQSTERYRNTAKSIPDIAGELDVNYIVQGNVQRFNDHVKVFASLVNGETGQQIWADEFSGEMKDIFYLQDDIAKKIAAELQVKLSPEEKRSIERVSTRNISAWEKYNEAQDLYVKMVLKNRPTYSTLQNDRLLYEEYLSVLTAINEVIAKDAEFAEAKILKGKIFLFGLDRGGFGLENGSKRISPDSIKILAQDALKTDPVSVDGYCLMASFFNIKQMKDSVGWYVSKAINTNPNSFDANKNAGDYYLWNDNQKALKYYLKAARVDPVSIWTPEIFVSLGQVYSNIGDFQKSEAYLKTGLEKLETNQGLFWLLVLYNHWQKPDSVMKYAGRMLKYGDKNALYLVAEVTCYQLNQWEKGEKLYEELWNKYHEHVNEHRWALALYKTGNTIKGDELMEKSFQFYLKNLPSSYDMAGLYAFREDRVNAYRVLRNFDWGWTSAYLIQFDPLFDKIRNDVQFKEMLAGVLEAKRKQREKLSALEARKEL